MTSDSVVKQRRMPWALVLLGLVFLGPLVAAWLLFGQADVWRPQSSHYGTLVEPLLLPGDYAPDLPTELAPETLRGQWILLVLVPRPHTDDTARLLHGLHQLHVALGKHADRMQRIVVTDGELPAMEMAMAQDPRQRVVETTPPGLARLLARLPGASGSTRGLFLIDPLGNLMMRYPVPPASRGLLDDLRRLMRTSRIG